MKKNRKQLKRNIDHLMQTKSCGHRYDTPCACGTENDVVEITCHIDSEGRPSVAISVPWGRLAPRTDRPGFSYFCFDVESEHATNFVEALAGAIETARLEAAIRAS